VHKHFLFAIDYLFFKKEIIIYLCQYKYFISLILKGLAGLIQPILLQFKIEKLLNTGNFSNDIFRTSFQFYKVNAGTHDIILLVFSIPSI